MTFGSHTNFFGQRELFIHRLFVFNFSGLNEPYGDDPRGPNPRIFKRNWNFSDWRKDKLVR